MKIEQGRMTSENYPRFWNSFIKKGIRQNFPILETTKRFNKPCETIAVTNQIRYEWMMTNRKRKIFYKITGVKHPDIYRNEPLNPKFNLFFSKVKKVDRKQQLHVNFLCWIEWKDVFWIEFQETYDTWSQILFNNNICFNWTN